MNLNKKSVERNPKAKKEAHPSGNQRALFMCS